MSWEGGWDGCEYLCADDSWDSWACKWETAFGVHLDGLWDISELHMLMHVSIISLALSSCYVF